MRPYLAELFLISLIMKLESGKVSAGPFKGDGDEDVDNLRKIQ